MKDNLPGKGKKEIGKLVRLIGGTILSLPLVLGTLSGCQPIEKGPPEMLTPPKGSVFEGSPYSSFVHFSNGDRYYITVNPETQGAPRYDTFMVTPSPNGVLIHSGDAPQISKNEDYIATLNASNSYGTTTYNWRIIEINTD